MSFRLTILPDAVRFDLGGYAEDATPDVHPYAGYTAVCKPLDTETIATWHDMFPTDETRHAAASMLVKQQLIAIEGIPVEQGGPYDHATHWRALGATLDGRNIISLIYVKLWERANLSEQQEKNFVSPSGSDNTTPLVA